MKRKLATITLAAISLFMVLIPVLAPSAAFAASNPVKSNVFLPTILEGPLTICVGAASSNLGGNKLPVCNNLCDFVAQVANIIYFVMGVVIWVISPVLAAVGGIMIMLGGTNPEMISRGKKTLTGVVWGLVIILCAWLIVFSFVGAFGSLSKYVGGFGGSGGQAACTVPGSSAASVTAP